MQRREFLATSLAAAAANSTTDAVRTDLYGGQVAEFISLLRAHYQLTLAAQPEEHAPQERNSWLCK